VSKFKIWLLGAIQKTMKIRNYGSEGVELRTFRAINTQIQEEAHLFYFGSTRAGLGVSKKERGFSPKVVETKESTWLQ
jgi:hypothetical protein